MDKNLTVGFIGLGIMGKPMSLNLKKAGFDVNVYNRTKEKADEIVALGGKYYSSPKEIAENSDIIITIVSDTPDVKNVILGKDGVIEGVKPGTVVIDMSTISPDAAREINKELKKVSCSLVDAPVSGGEAGAVNGQLTIMAGGDEDAYNKCIPLFDVMGKKATYMGPSGAGQVTKLCNQITACLTLLGASEGLMLASKEGLDLDKYIGALSAGSAQSTLLETMGPKIIERDFQPGFFLELMQKDLRIVADTIKSLNLPLPGTALVEQLYASVAAGGEGKLGHHALVKSLEKMASHEISK